MFRAEASNSFAVAVGICLPDCLVTLSTNCAISVHAAAVSLQARSC